MKFKILQKDLIREPSKLEYEDWQNVVEEGVEYLMPQFIGDPLSTLKKWLNKCTKTYIYHAINNFFAIEI